jgi:hypothetical protein
VLNLVIDGLVLASPTLASATSSQLDFGEYATLVEIPRDSTTGVLTPVACWGSIDDISSLRGPLHPLLREGTSTLSATS